MLTKIERPSKISNLESNSVSEILAQYILLNSYIVSLCLFLFGELRPAYYEAVQEDLGSSKRNKATN